MVYEKSRAIKKPPQGASKKRASLGGRIFGKNPARTEM
jgi:hypothetical protein